MIDPGLEGKVALVTGANSGIGAATARALGAQGSSVILHYLDSTAREGAEGAEFHHSAPGRAAAEAVADEVEAAGGRAKVVEGNLSGSHRAHGRVCSSMRAQRRQWRQGRQHFDRCRSRVRGAGRLRRQQGRARAGSPDR